MLKKLRNRKSRKDARRDLYLGALALLIMFALALIGRLSDGLAAKRIRA